MPNPNAVPAPHLHRPASRRSIQPRREPQSRAAPPPAEERDALLLRHLDTLDTVTLAVARERGLGGPDAEDFQGWVRLKVIENDAARLRAFDHRCSWRTYLNTVVVNLYRDYLDLERGKWRPSAAARRLGPEAVALDRLLNRDRVGLVVAMDRLLPRRPGRAERRRLIRLAAQLPHRPHRRFEGLHRDLLGDDDANPEEALLVREHEERAGKQVRSLERAIRTLPPPDQLLLRLRFWEGMKVSDIARSLHCPQKPLYRRIQRLLVRLRAQLTSEPGPHNPPDMRVRQVHSSPARTTTYEIRTPGRPDERGAA